GLQHGAEGQPATGLAGRAGRHHHHRGVTRMTFSGDAALRETREKMNKAVQFLEDELRGIRTGRATPALVENIHVEAYGAQQALKNVAQIMVPEPKSIQIKPFDPSIIKDIERAILASNLGI